MIKIPPESISEYPIFEIFLRGMPPDPPSNSTLDVLCTTLINLLKQPIHILIVWLDHLKFASYVPGVYIYIPSSIAHHHQTGLGQTIGTNLLALFQCDSRSLYIHYQSQIFYYLQMLENNMNMQYYILMIAMTVYIRRYAYNQDFIIIYT